MRNPRGGVRENRSEEIREEASERMNPTEGARKEKVREEKSERSPRG